MDEKRKIVADGSALNRLAVARPSLYLAMLALPVISGALLVAQSGLLALVLHRAIVEAVPLEALVPFLAGLAGLVALRAVLGAIGEQAGIVNSETAKLRLRTGLFAKLLRRPPTETAALSSGAVSTALVEQVGALDGYFARYLPAMVQAAILPLAFAIVVLPVDWVVGLLFIVTAPLIPVFMALVGWGAEAASRTQASALARLGGRFADRLRGLTTLRLFGAEKGEIASVRAASEELRHRTMRVMRIAFLSSAVLEFFAALGVAGVALYVGLTLLDLVSLRGGAELTLWAGLFCLLMAPEVYQPLRLLAAHYHDRAAARAALEELALQFHGLPPSGEQPLVPVAEVVPVPEAARLELVGLSLQTPGGRALLDGADLELAPGDRVAILGASGIGKSTLLEAIAGLRGYEGMIRLDGADVAALAEPQLRQRVAMLSQRPHIFSGTIADNIRLGRQAADHPALRQAAHLAHVTDFADELPEGLATRIGENGLGLSGGEIQRIALARIYLRQPGLVLLDEPTAHLDAATESAVLDDLLAFAAGRTLLVVTHSAAVAARMDRVYRIAAGQLLPAPRPAARAGKAGAA